MGSTETLLTISSFETFYKIMKHKITFNQTILVIYFKLCAKFYIFKNRALSSVPPNKSIHDFL